MNKSFPPEAGYLACPDFTASERMRRRAHAIIPGGAHTYAKGDDQFPGRRRASSRAARAPRVGRRRQRVHRVRHGPARGRRSATPIAPVVEAAAAQIAHGTNFTRPRRSSSRRREAARAGRRRRDGQVRQERLRRHLRRREAGPRLHRTRPGRDLRRPPVLLRRRLVHRHDRDGRRHPAGDPRPDASVPLQRPRQPRARCSPRIPGEIAMRVLEPARPSEPPDRLPAAGLRRSATPTARCSSSTR